MNYQYDDQDKDVLVLQSKGGIDDSLALKLLHELDDLINKGLRKIVFDCTGLDYMSSLDLSLLARLHTRIAKQGGDLKLCCVNERINEILGITNLNQLFEIHVDLEQARQAFEAR